MPKRRNAGAKRNPVASRSMKARTTRGTRRSPDRLRERSQKGSGFGNRPIPRGSYDPMTYSKPDVASLGDPVSNYAVANRKRIKAQDFMPDPTWKGGRGNYDDPTVPTRRMAGGRPFSNPVDGPKRRRASTQDSLRRADTSMFNYDD
ncbi:MAG: hypothetical protein CL882_03460 [Dehalococcoidia bacterium]|nr:hypothetical protein [Dehalococcoidia bacterium]